MGIKDLTVAELRKLPLLPSQVLLRMGIVRAKHRILCRTCSDIVNTAVAYDGNDTWNIECVECGSSLAYVDTENVFQDVDGPFIEEK
jgi:hypothetical protein